MTTLVFGKTGQVARELQALAPVLALGRDEADLTDPSACASAIRKHNPSAVVNAAAYNDVDKAEDEEALANRINGETPAAIAAVCAERDIPIVQISTDYVFNGSGERGWLPDDIPEPLGAYGRSKLVGERGVEEAQGRYAIMRTSWVFSSHRHNFLKTMLRLARSRSELRVVNDQVGGPTAARDIANACLVMVEKLQNEAEVKGIYQYSAVPDLSWA